MSRKLFDEDLHGPVEGVLSRADFESKIRLPEFSEGTIAITPRFTEALKFKDEFSLLGTKTGRISSSNRTIKFPETDHDWGKLLDEDPIEPLLTRSGLEILAKEVQGSPFQEASEYAREEMNRVLKMHPLFSLPQTRMFDDSATRMGTGADPVIAAGGGQKAAAQAVPPQGAPQAIIPPLPPAWSGTVPHGSLTLGIVPTRVGVKFHPPLPIKLLNGDIGKINHIDAVSGPAYLVLGALPDGTRETWTKEGNVGVINGGSPYDIKDIERFNWALLQCNDAGHVPHIDIPIWVQAFGSGSQVRGNTATQVIDDEVPTQVAMADFVCVPKQDMTPKEMCQILIHAGAIPTTVSEDWLRELAKLDSNLLRHFDKE